MVFKIFFVVALALVLAMGWVVYDSYVSPEYESDLAIQQMEFDDGAALELRVASRTLAYQYPIALIVWIGVSALVFRREAVYLTKLVLGEVK